MKNILLGSCCDNDNEFSRLKGYMTEYVNTLTEDKKSKIKDEIQIIKNLGLLD